MPVAAILAAAPRDMYKNEAGAACVNDDGYVCVVLIWPVLAVDACNATELACCISEDCCTTEAECKALAVAADTAVGIKKLAGIKYGESLAD